MRCFEWIAKKSNDFFAMTSKRSRHHERGFSQWHNKQIRHHEEWNDVVIQWFCKKFIMVIKICFSSHPFFFLYLSRKRKKNVCPKKKENTTTAVGAEFVSLIDKTLFCLLFFWIATRQSLSQWRVFMDCHGQQVAFQFS